MKLIHRYLASALLRGYILAGSVFFALFGLFEFIEQADNVGDADFAIADALLITALALPARLVDLSPFVAMLGVVYGLGTLSQTHELIAIRAAGLAPHKLSVICVMTSLSFMVVVSMIEFGVRPMAQQAELLLMASQSTDGAMFTKDGIWVQQGRNYLHIEALNNSGSPSGVHLYEFAENDELDKYLRAEQGYLDDSGNWQLLDVTEKRYSTGGGPTVTTHHFPDLAWQGAASRNLAFYGLPLQSLTLPELHVHMRYLASQQQVGGVYGLEFWHRCLLPVSAMVFTLFVVPFLLAVSPRTSKGWAVTQGVALALLLYLVQQLFTNSIYLLVESALLAETLSLLLVAMPAVWLVVRANRGGR